MYQEFELNVNNVPPVELNVTNSPTVELNISNADLTARSMVLSEAVKESADVSTITTNYSVADSVTLSNALVNSIDGVARSMATSVGTTESTDVSNIASGSHFFSS